MNSQRQNRGIVLPIMLFVVLFVVTAGSYLLNVTTHDLKVSHMFRKLKTSSTLANNVVTDLMRQFSQNYQENHYDADRLNRNPAFYSNGFSSVTITANEDQHFIFFSAIGAYGSDLNNPQHQKKIEGVIKFISDLTTFGTMWRDNFTTSASNATYVGKVWANGNWTISGNNTVVQGGPVFVNGNIATSGGGSLVINGDLYRGGNLTGNIVVNGSDNNYMPDMTWPTLDSDYYDTYSNVKVTADTTVRFYHDGVSSTGTVTVGTNTYVIPPTGFIIYGENCTLTSSGTIRGRVTLASFRVSGGVGGRIAIDNDIKYATAGSTSNANSNDSFAAISSHRMTWTKAGFNQYRYISGSFFIDHNSSTERFYTTGGSNTSGLKFFGTRNKGISGTFNLGASIEFDPFLDTYPPPGLPEKPVLVTWNVK